MLDARQQVLPSRAAMVASSGLTRLMGYLSMFIGQLTSAPAAWCVAIENGRGLDPLVPPVIWMSESEIERAGGYENSDPLRDISADERAILEQALETDQMVIRIGGENGQPDVSERPLAGLMAANQMLTRALLVGRYDGRLWAVMGLQRREDAGGLSAGELESLTQFGPLLGHTFSVASKIERERTQQWATALASLSVRETQVAKMVSVGAPNSEIAQALDITTGTVKVHLHRAFEKLGVDSRTRLALLMSEAEANERS